MLKYFRHLQTLRRASSYQDGNADSAQEAYQLLQRGVKRYEQTGRLLRRKEVAFVLNYRSRLVLSAPERFLLEASEEAMAGGNGRPVKLALGITFAVVVLGGISLFFLNSGPKFLPAERGIANRQPEAIYVGSNRSSRKNTDYQIMKESAPSPQSAESPFAASASGEESFFPEAPAPPAAEALASKESPENETMEAPVSLSVRESSGTRNASHAEAQGLKEHAAAKNAAPVAVGDVQLAMEDSKWGLMNSDGKFLLQPEYDRILPFPGKEGLFLIEKSGRQGLARTDGTIVVYPYFELIKSYYEKVQLLVVVNGGKSGVYDEKEQRFALGLEYKDICCLSDGLFAVQMTNDKWGFIDRWGNTVIPPAYEAVEKPFRNGKATVRLDGKEIIIDLSGNTVVDNRI